LDQPSLHSKRNALYRKAKDSGARDSISKVGVSRFAQPSGEKLLDSIERGGDHNGITRAKSRG
jgi:hypothetical protein